MISCCARAVRCSPNAIACALGLHRLQAAGDSTPLVARFLRDAAALAQREHAAIASISVPAASGRLQGRAEAPASIELSVTVEGRYAAVLAVVRALSALHVPAGIDVVSIVRSSRPGAATVSAVLRVALGPIEPAQAIDVRDRS